MATSLARQLAALRTPATQALSADGGYYNGPFLFTEADQKHCDMHQLKDRMIESLDALIELEPAFDRYKDFLTHERIEKDKLESENIEELLFLLSPYLLMKPAQWVLQYLVIKNKVHYKYPELFFFCVLPYYEYDIYAKSLLAVDTTPDQTSYPNWLKRFKTQCAPTTKLALYRHTAADKGFLKLLTDTMIRLIKMTVNFPTMRLQRQTSMFVMTILGGLENKDRVTEEQSLYLLQVIFKGMKVSPHPELIAMSQILLSYLLPKLAFKEKVVVKFLKCLKSCIKKNATMECLMVLIMIARTQSSLQMEKAWPVMVSLETVINMALNHLDDPETCQNMDDILYTLAAMIRPALPAKNTQFVSFPQEANQLLSFAVHILNTVKVSSDTAAFIGEIAYSIIRGVRATAANDVIDAAAVKHAQEQADVVMKQINNSYPEVYQQIVVDTDDIDLFVLTKGSLTKKPEEGLVAAKRVILNNNFVNVVKERLINPKLKLDKKALKVWSKNANDVTALLSVDTEFLLDNLPERAFQNFLFNTLNFLPYDEKVVQLALGHLCDKQVWQNDQQDGMEVDGDAPGKLIKNRVSQYRLELAVLPYFCKEKSVFRTIIIDSFFGKKSELISSLSSISDEHPDKAEALRDKLRQFVTTELTRHVMADMFIWQNIQILSLVLPALKEKVVWNQINVDKSDMIRFIGELMVAYPEMEDKKTEGVVLELLDCSNFTTTIKNGVDMMECMPRLIDAGAKKFVAAIEQQIELKTKDYESALLFNLNCCVQTKCIRTIYTILSPIAQLVQTREFADTLLNPATNILPLLLYLVLSEEQVIRKLGFAIIKKLKKMSDGKKYNGLINFLNASRSELITDVDNLTALLKKADTKADDEGSSLASGAVYLLQSVTKVDPVVCETLMPFFTNVKSIETIKDVAEFGSKLIKTGENDNVLASVIKKFYKKIIKEIAEPSCYNFFLDCLGCSRVVILVGIKSKISDVMLDRCASKKLWSSLPQDILAKLLQDAVVLSAESSNVKLISMLCLICIPVNIINTLFYNIWGEDNLKSKSRGARLGFSTKDVVLDQQELKIWGGTVFVLELLDCYLPSYNSTDASTLPNPTDSWQTVIPTIFAVFRKLSNDDVMESSYKLNLILTVLLKLFTMLPNERIKELKQEDLEAELLTYCIRRSSNPESRQLALKVLARCSVTIPEYVLQNSLTIFTFMGTHLLKMDSKHSYQIACETIDVIIPAMKSTSNSKAELQKLSLEILNNFIHMEEDVPEHRYSEFVFRLLKALDADTYLWIAMLLCIKSTFKAQHRAKKIALIHTRLIELMQRFELHEALRGIIGLFVNLRGDAPALRKIFGCPQDRREDQDKADEWDVLRLGGLILAAKLGSSTELCSRVGRELLTNQEQIKDLLYLMLEASMMTLKSFSDLPASTPEKLKSDILEQCDKCVQCCLSLLPYKMYISLVTELLASEDAALRRNAMEIVCSKMDVIDEDIDLADDAALLTRALLDLAVKETSAENQTTAFLSLRQVAKHVKDYSLLNTAMATLNPKFLATLSDPKVLGAAILTLTDIALTTGVNGLQNIVTIVEWVIASLDKLPTQHVEEKYEKLLYISLLLALEKLVEKFEGFINPYVEQIVLITCRLYSHNLAAQRARVLWNSLVKHLAPHIVLEKANKMLLEVWQEPATVAKLSGLVGLVSKRLDRVKLKAMDRQVVKFYSKALSYRQEHEPSDQVNAAESEIIESFLSVGMIMRLPDFKAVFDNIIENLKQTDDDLSYVTVFNFIERIGNSLKNLFSFGKDFVLVEATRVLNLESTSTLCTDAILRCVNKVFMYNSIIGADVKNDIYEGLTDALVKVYQKDASLYQSLQDALLTLAECTVDDAYWKYLNSTVINMLRHNNSAVKIQILRVVKRFVTVCKDTYLAVLPDAVPFLTECLEDDDQEVEKECRSLIHHMETVFGQDLEDYFS